MLVSSGVRVAGGGRVTVAGGALPCSAAPRPVRVDYWAMAHTRTKTARAEDLEYGTGWRQGHHGNHSFESADADGNEDGDAAYFGTGCAVGYIKRGTFRGKTTTMGFLSCLPWSYSTDSST